MNRFKKNNMKLDTQQRRILRIRRCITKKGRFKEFRNHGDPHHAELRLRLDGRKMNPPTDAKVQRRLNAKLESRRQLRVERRNEIFATRWIKRVEEGEQDTDMAGLFALERTLTFLSFFTAPRTKLKLIDIHLFLLCGGEEGVPMKVASDMTGLNYHALRMTMRKLIKLGYLGEERPVQLPGGTEEIFIGRNHLEMVFPYTRKGEKLRTDLAKFDTRDFHRMFGLMQKIDTEKNVEPPQERLRAAVKATLEEMQSKLRLDW